VGVIYYLRVQGLSDVMLCLGRVVPAVWKGAGFFICKAKQVKELMSKKPTTTTTTTTTNVYLTCRIILEPNFQLVKGPN
jgi:hypothetical protein